MPTTAFCLAQPNGKARWVRAWSELRTLDIAPLPNALAALYQEKEIVCPYSLRKLWIGSGPRTDTENTDISLILTRDGHWMALSMVDESAMAKYWRDTAMLAKRPNTTTSIPALWKHHGHDVHVADIGTFIAPVGPISSAHQQITITVQAAAATPLYRRILGADNNDDHWMGDVPWENPTFQHA